MAPLRALQRRSEGLPRRAATIAGLILVAGCRPHPVAVPPAPISAPSEVSPEIPRKKSHLPPGTVLARTLADLTPEADPGPKALLSLGISAAAPKNSPPTTEFPVAIVRRHEGSETSLSLLTGGEAIEREIYDVRDGHFRVVAAGEGTFAPPLELLRPPVAEGPAGTWKGSLVYAGISREAHASVEAHRDGKDVRIDVALLVATDPGRPPLRRNLTFWFRKGRGVVRRSFAEVSSRRPPEEPWQP